MSRPTLLVLLAIACNQDNNITQLYPEIAVAPAELAFGDLATLRSDTQVVFITNGGRAPLSFDARVEGDTAFHIEPTQLDLPRDDTFSVPVTFTPTSFLSYTGELVIRSNDEESPEIRVPLSGTGVAAPTPDIEISPLTLDFGTVDVGATDTQFLSIKNVGDASLTLGYLQQVGSGAFSLYNDPSNNIIGRSSESLMAIEYHPTNAAGDSATLHVPSDDPDEPELEVLLLGNGGGDFDYPIAAIDCPHTSAPPQWVALDGSGSSDPNHYDPLTYAWTLSDQPEGSQETLTNLTTSSTDLFTDLAGDYEVQLVVTNALGTQSAPDRCVIHAIPLDAIHVELSWDTPSADLDLHVARNNGDLFRRTDDCSYCNPGPNWGALGTDDNPRLDLDDVGGYGPENINLLSPAESSYKVRVHYWEKHNDDAVNATVRVYTNGHLAWEGGRVMSENDVWDVGVVNWPDGTFGVLSEENYTSPQRGCF